MNEIILSLRPEWWEKMISGEKTLEIRKSKPHRFFPPLKVYVHVSGIKGIAGEFMCNKITTLQGIISGRDLDGILKKSCLSVEQLRECGENVKRLYAFGVSDVFPYTSETDYSNAVPLSKFDIKRPPQSWCYVKEATP